MRRFLIALAGLLVLAAFAPPALTAPLSDEAKKDLDETLFKASIFSNPKQALEVCREAERKAAEYDPDPFYTGAVAKCLAMAETHMISHYKYAACAHYARALEGLQAVGADHPRQDDVKKWLERVHQDREKLGCGSGFLR